MVSRTCELGIRAAIFLALADDPLPVTPKRLAEALGASPTYMAKVTGLLVYANILRSFRGAHGGVRLERDPEKITVLELVEACQGHVVADFCEPIRAQRPVCAFHRAMQEVHEATVEILSRWTLGELIARPCPLETLAGKVRCRMNVSAPRERDAGA